jgi:hypothetical protein
LVSYYLKIKDTTAAIRYVIKIVNIRLKENVKTHIISLINGNHSCADIGIRVIIMLTTVLPT